MLRIKLILLSMLLACAPTTMAHAQAAAPASLSFDDALRIATEAVKIAKARGGPIGVVVVNREGRVLVALRMDDVSFMNLDVAQSKAVTAAALGVPTDAIEQAIEGGKTSLLAVSGLGAIGGGVPIMRGGKVVAGIGVSGGTPADDKTIAEAAIALK